MCAFILQENKELGLWPIKGIQASPNGLIGRAMMIARAAETENRSLLDQ